METKPLRETGAALGLTGEAGRNALNRMKALFKTVANLVWPDPNEPKFRCRGSRRESAVAQLSTLGCYAFMKWQILLLR
jgi:hypothetical protein